jgi:hypothetical protein
VGEGSVCEVHVDVFVPQIGVGVSAVDGSGGELGFVWGRKSPAGEGAGCWAWGNIGVSSYHAGVMSDICVLEVWCFVALRGAWGMW